VIQRVPEQRLSEMVSAGTRLLRVESDGSRALCLRFDRGAVRIALEDGGLVLEIGGGAAQSADAEVLDEADPWWTVIGQPLQGAWSQIDTEKRRVVLELQLRRDDESPKIVAVICAVTVRDSRNFCRTASPETDRRTVREFFVY